MLWRSALHGAAGLGHDFVEQVARTVHVADLAELFGQLELARERVLVSAGIERRQVDVAKA